MANRADIEELRKYLQWYKQWGAEKMSGYKELVMMLLEAAPALLDEIERLRKIEERLQEECCLTCLLYGCRHMASCTTAAQRCDDWRPISGEKEARDGEAM